jgi:hypothetical protein
MIEFELAPLIFCHEDFVVAAIGDPVVHVVGDLSEEEVHNETSGVEVPERELRMKILSNTSLSRR